MGQLSAVRIHPARLLFPQNWSTYFSRQMAGIHSKDGETLGFWDLVNIPPNISIFTN